MVVGALCQRVAAIRVRPVAEERHRRQQFSLPHGGAIVVVVVGDAFRRQRRSMPILLVCRPLR